MSIIIIFVVETCIIKHYVLYYSILFLLIDMKDDKKGVEP